MIQLRGVSYTYPDSAFPALRDIDLAVADGEWLLLAGPSGGGKSTLLYLLNGLVPHVLGGEIRGHVEINGLVPANVPVRELSRRVGTVFQNPETQLFMLRVGEDVAFGCENLGLPPVETQGRVERALAQVSLASLREQEVFTSRAARNSDWPSPGPWRWAAGPSCWTSPPATSTPRAVRSCWRSCGACTRQGTRS